MALAFCLGLCAGAWASGDERPGYDLRPGDHLVYEQQLDRDVESPVSRITTRVRWRTHLLVTGVVGGSLRVGIQRNRTAADLLRYEENGRDRRETEGVAFAARLAATRPAFAEANWFTRSGATLLPSLVVREGRSELLPYVRELPPLPSRPVAIGDTWLAGALGLSFRVVSSEMVGGETCLRQDGADAAKTLRMRLWWCPASGTVPRLELDGNYSAPPNANVTEKIRVELVERRRGEDPRAWLADPAAREGELAAFLVSEALPVEPAAVLSLLDADDVAVQRKALAVLYRHRLPPPALETLSRLLASADDRLRTLAVRNLERVPEAAARPLFERARADADSFVARAAEAGLRRFDPPKEPTLARLARAVRDGGPLPAWTCGEMADWPARALREQGRPGQPPGATLRDMVTPGFTDRVYVMSVPDDYRGDEPFPLLIVLGGGPGRAVPTAQMLRDPLSQHGYLALIPQAGMRWWDKETTAAVAALLPEVLRAYNVDTNRVFLTGFSNGGTGTFLYASLWPYRLAAAASLMGGGVPFFATEAPPVGNVAALPFLFLHGDRDEVIPVRATLETVSAIRRFDPEAPLESHILKGRGHDIVLDEDDHLTLPFFASRQRQPFPRRIRFATRSLDFARGSWLEITSKEGGLAEVEAEIGADNVVVLKTRRVTGLRLLLRRELVSADGPVVVQWNGREAFRGAFREDCALLASSWQKEQDPFLAHSFEVMLGGK